MINSQLGRTLLSRSSLSVDQQDATPDETGSYGELMDAIDRIIEPTESDGQTPNPEGGHPSAGLAFPRPQE
jgi:hypothetical protein